MNAGSFKEAYGVLQQHAAMLRDQTEPNIDDLLTIVTESVEAYKVCKERIDAVESALKTALEGVGTATAVAMTRESATNSQQSPAATPRSAKMAPPQPGVDTSDDDIPF